MIFANQLRGVAALAVVASHLIGVFWAMRDFVSLATASPPQAGPLPPIFSVVSYQWLNFGPLGVGIFFLISGLVIPISLHRHTGSGFLLARMVRIFPTYLVAVLIDVAVIHAASANWGRPFPYNTATILNNALLTYSLTGYPSIDLVNWTLVIELKFYLLMLVLAPRIRRGEVAPLIISAGIILLLNVGLHWLVGTGFAPRHLAAFNSLSMETTYLIFMLIGVIFYYHLHGHLRTLPAIVCGTVILGIFLGSWRISWLAPQYPVVTVNYFYALVIFGTAYTLRRHARRFAPLDFMAAISFPLYLVHSLVGFLSLKYFMLLAGWRYLPSLVATVGVVIGLATVLHLAVEGPCMRLWRRANATVSKKFFFQEKNQKTFFN